MKGIKSHGKRYHSLDFNTIPLLSTGTCEMVHFIKIHFSFNRRKKKKNHRSTFLWLLCYVAATLHCDMLTLLRSQYTLKVLNDTGVICILSQVIPTVIYSIEI